MTEKIKNWIAEIENKISKATNEKEKEYLAGQVKALVFALRSHEEDHKESLRRNMNKNCW